MPGELGSSPEELGLEQDEIVEKETEKYPFNGGIIVFGHGWAERSKSGGWQLSPEAKMRATAAYQLWKEGLAPRIILTGGPPTENQKEKYGQDIVANSEQMAVFLRERFHVPEENILFENQSFKTVDNVAHALNELENKGLSTNDFLTVSTGYHMDRISEIMSKFDLESRPISAEQALNSRALEHANKMKEREIAAGKDSETIKKNFLARKGLYDRAIHRIYRNNETIQSEFKDENRWLKATQEMPGYWLPLALAVRGDKLRELVTIHRSAIEEWLSRHPNIGMTVEDLIEGNFDYKDLVKKGREMPTEEK